MAVSFQKRMLSRGEGRVLIGTDLLLELTMLCDGRAAARIDGLARDEDTHFIRGA
jgi:hypothetical protein